MTVATVVGYHGCRRAFADGVRSGRITLADWKPSRNVYDWLGEGVYFWEGSRSRAAQWAVEQFGTDGDDLEAEIDLSECLDLLENTYHAALRGTYRDLRAAYSQLGWTLPLNRKGRHDLDCLVINRFVELMKEFADPRDVRVRSIRCPFEEGRPLFPGSAIRSESHIQLAVRDVRCIRVREERRARP